MIDISALALDALYGDDDALAVLCDVIEEQIGTRGGSARRRLKALRSRDWMRLVALIPVERLAMTASDARRIIGPELPDTGYAMTSLIIRPHETGYIAYVGEASGKLPLRGSWPTREEAEAAARAIMRVIHLARGRCEEQREMSIAHLLDSSET